MANQRIRRPHARGKHGLPMAPGKFRNASRRRRPACRVGTTKSHCVKSSGPTPPQSPTNHSTAWARNGRS